MIGNSNSALQIENLKSENIRKHVTILGVTGTYSSIPDAVDSGVFWTNPDDDGYYQDCEYVNYPYSSPLSLKDETNKATRVKRIKLTNCKDMTNVMDNFAYSNNYLEEIDLEDSGITSIENSAFASCPHLEQILLPSTLTSIGYSAFARCPHLEQILLPSTLTSIENSAFRYDHFSEAVKLPASLTSIGDDAFSNGGMPFCDCTELTYTGSTPNTAMTGRSFQGTSYPLKFKDQATMEVYASATNWSTYASRMTYEGAE